MASAPNDREENLILIVEDSPTQAEKLQYILEKHNYLVKACANGREALAALQSIRPLTVISDIVMPEMNGYDLCRQIKKSSALAGIPVILLTSLNEPEDVIMGLECGADYFIMKPYNECFLLSRLQHIIANRHLGDSQSPQMGIEIYFRDKKYFINSDRLQILNLLLSTYETALQKNQELDKATDDLILLNQRLENSMAELDAQNEDLARLNLELQDQKAAAEAAKREALAASRAKSDFLANMSHELRTPLNSVIGFSEVLEDELFGPLNEKQRTYVANILSSGKHLLSLINDILDLSKVEAGKMELEPSLVNLSEVLMEAHNLLKEKAYQHGIGMTIDIGTQEGLELIADKRKFKQILFNLLSNAIKFTPQGGEVRITAKRVQNGSDSRSVAPETAPWRDYLEIAVIDTGIGIRSVDLPKLFKEFTQLNSPYTKEQDGTGLGLALTKRLVELHGGRIRAESKGPGQGSRFTFVMPLQQEKKIP